MNKMNRFAGWVTVYTDASVSSTRCGIAYYIRHDHGTIKDAEELPRGEHGSFSAECMALARALEIVRDDVPYKPVGLFVRTDNMSLVEVIKGQNRNKSAEAQAVRDMINCIGVPVRVEHVKAHTRRNDRRSWINRWVDLASRTGRTYFSDEELAG